MDGSTQFSPLSLSWFEPPLHAHAAHLPRPHAHPPIHTTSIERKISLRLDSSAFARLLSLRSIPPASDGSIPDGQCSRSREEVVAGLSCCRPQRAAAGGRPACRGPEAFQSGRGSQVSCWCQGSPYSVFLLERRHPHDCSEAGRASGGCR